jgi:DNA invertase Pin-like site-specific DNA recombinase
VSGESEDDLTAKRREWSRLGGRIGGKMSLRTMTPWARKVQAHNAGLKGGRKIRIDHAKVRELRAQGLKYREIAEQLGISIPSVSRIVKEGKP